MKPDWPSKSINTNCELGSQTSQTEPPPALRVTVLGHCERLEFQAAMRVLRDNAHVTVEPFPAPCTFSRPRASVGIASHDQLDSQPDLIVLLQSLAGEFTRQRLESICQMNPLAPLVCVLGSYSEGETRSGTPLEGAHRVFWHEAAPRLQLGFDAWKTGKCSWWSWPTTLTGTERQLIIPQPDARPPLAGKIGIFAATRAAAEPLADSLATVGANPVYVAPDAAVCPDLTVAIWDSAIVAGRFRPMPLCQAVALTKPASLIALVTFPRTQDVELAAASGAWGVLPRLHDVADLHWYLRQAAQHTAATDINLRSSVA